jgi:hypothetical protein
MISNSFLVELFGLLDTGSCHMQMGIVWILPSLFESILFIALFLLLWLVISKLY